MVALEGIQEAHPRMTYNGIHQLVYLRHGERIFWAGLVQICEVHEYPPFSIFLLHNHSIGQPLKVEHLFNSPSLLNFHHLVFDSIRMIFREAPRWLFSRDDRWIDVQMMTDEARIHPRSFISNPSEYINVSLEKFYQLFFLLR